MAPATIPVALGSRSYDVLVGPGLMARAADLIKARLGPGKCGIVTDRNVAARHLAPLEASLRSAGLYAGTEILPPGEATKSFAALAGLCGRLIEMGLERRDCVIALGGGVIGDLAGFAASIVRRGMPFVQMPTTLLAQVDSSVGGKTGINTPQGKNLVGAFHQPRLVLADTDVLATLPPQGVPGGLRGGCQVRPARRRRLFRLAGAERAGRVRQGRGGADPRHRRRRARQGRHRRPRRDGNGRAHAAQPRPHVRPCARDVGRLLRPAAARRSHRHRHLPCLPAVRGAGVHRQQQRGAGRERTSPPSACRPASPTSRAAKRPMPQPSSRSWVRTRRCARAG